MWHVWRRQVFEFSGGKKLNKKKKLMSLGLDGCDRMVSKEIGREGVK
jgi:hypothetical protein